VKVAYRVPIVAGGLVLLLVASAIVAVSLVNRALPGTIDYRVLKQVVAGRALQVNTENASIEIVPGGNDRIELTAIGRYTTREPTVSIATTGKTTAVTGDCRSGERRCSLTLSLAVPALTDLRLVSATGSVRISGAAASIDASSTDGSVSTINSSGPTNIRTVNGSIWLDACRSQHVEASSTNGELALHFASPPNGVVGTSVNGQVSVRLPAGFGYRVAAQSVTAKDKIKVDQDPASPYAITAISTNGSVEVFS
jgi:hypothetical protein